MSLLTDIKGVGEARAKQLRDIGLHNAAAVAEATIEQMVQVTGISPRIAETLKAAARELLGQTPPEAPPEPSPVEEDQTFTQAPPKAPPRQTVKTAEEIEAPPKKNKKTRKTKSPKKSKEAQKPKKKNKKDAKSSKPKKKKSGKKDTAKQGKKNEKKKKKKS